MPPARLLRAARRTARIQPFVVMDVLARARRKGATQCETDASESYGQTVTVRCGEVDLGTIICYERHFPGIARDAAEFLANKRKVSMVGIDTASLDHGPSKDFITHQVLNGANVAGLENVANLDQLPESGYLVLALPMKIGGGSGAPTRVVALLEMK